MLTICRDSSVYSALPCSKLKALVILTLGATALQKAHGSKWPRCERHFQFTSSFQWVPVCPVMTAIEPVVVLLLLPPGNKQRWVLCIKPEG